MGRRSFADGSPMTADPATAQPGSTKSESVDLARCPDFKLGSVRVSPASRMLSGPAGEIMLEPRVMQVLVALADASGEVVSRDTLLERCWHGQIVGDDSVHRAIGELRRGVRAAGADFTVETIARVGHRLRLPESLAVDPPVHSSRWSRRRVLAASAAAATVAGAIGYAWLGRPGRDPRVAELIAQGRLALRPEEWDSTQQAVGYLRRAVRPSAGSIRGGGRRRHPVVAADRKPKFHRERTRTSPRLHRDDLA